MAESKATAAQTKGLHRLMKAMRHGGGEEHLAPVKYWALIGPTKRAIQAFYWLIGLR